jgi:ribose transport system permease protein
MQRVSAALRRLFTDHGMVLVLLLLCAFFSLVTWSEQQPTGELAARLLARDIEQQFGKDAHVLVVTGVLPDDTLFAEHLRAMLLHAEVVKGEPREARQALKRLAAAPAPDKLAAIACTATTAGWLALKDIDKDFPALGTPLIMKARSYSWPNFLKADNLLNITNQIAVIAIVAVGMTMVIIAGGIDLSVGSLIALSAVLSARLIRDYAGGTQAGALGCVLACAAGIAACGVAGLCSGALVTRFGIPPFIATLGMMLMGNGSAYILAKGESVYQLPDSFVWLGRGSGMFGLPHAVALMLGLYLAAHVLMSHTRLGRYLYAVGGNREAANLSGVPVKRVLLIAYGLCGLLSGLGGVVMASQLKSGSPTYGQMYELYVIAAVVVGGTSLEGGKGRMFGTLTGALIIAVIQNGMNLTGTESYTQKVVLGMVILLAVLFDRLKLHGWRNL